MVLTGGTDSRSSGREEVLLQCSRYVHVALYLSVLLIVNESRFGPYTYIYSVASDP